MSTRGRLRRALTFGLLCTALAACTRTAQPAGTSATQAVPPAANRVDRATHAVRPEAGRTALEDRTNAVLASTAIEPGANTIATHSAQIGDLTFALDQTIAIGMMTSFSTSRFALVVRDPHAVDVLDAKQKIVGRVTLEGSDIQLSFPTIGLGARARVHPGAGDAATRGLLFASAALVGSATILGGTGVAPVSRARAVAAPLARWAADAFDSVQHWSRK